MSQAGKYANGTMPGEFVRTLSDDVDTKVFPDGDGNIQLEGQNGITILGDTMNNKLTVFGGGISGNEIKVTKFTDNGTFDKDPRTIWLWVYLWNGGSGGGSGRQGASGLSSGGGGGAGGAFLCLNFPAMQFPTSVPVVIGQGGAGGAPQTNPDTNGNDGQPGGISYIGEISPNIKGNSHGRGGTTTGGLSGNGQNLVGPVDYIVASISNGGGSGTQTGGTNATIVGNAGSGVAYSNYFQYPSSGGGGGAGANISNIYAGGNGGNITQFGYQIPATSISLLNGGIGGIESATIDGSNGADFVSTNGGRVLGATGGGGGGGQSAGLVSGNGGHGGTPSGAGGGGGGSLNGTPSGAGGNGARGEIWVIEQLGTLIV